MNSTVHLGNLKCHYRGTVESGRPTTAIVMFVAGVLGNVLALVLLEIRRRKQSSSLFQVLVTALVITDLFGTFSVSPLVIAAYSRNESLVGMSKNGAVCEHFGFSMTFFSLVTLAILQSMALERLLAIGYPYFYERTTSKRCGYITISLIYLICILFCVSPFIGFGKYVQYCPGTWCFIDMKSQEQKHKVYALVYASCMLLLVTCTVFCNVSVIYHLFRMCQRRKANRGSFRRTRGYRRSFSLTEEVEHLILLAVMTSAFVICSVPLVLRVYINFTDASNERHLIDRGALLFLSANPIIDPWLYIILSPSVLRFLWGKLSRASWCPPAKSQSCQGGQQQWTPPMELQQPAVLY